jgi:disulfide bond formation protein DsbB
MSLSRDALLFSIVLMLLAVRIEARGYGSSGEIVLASLGIGLIGIVGSFVSSVASMGHRPDSDPSERSATCETDIHCTGTVPFVPAVDTRYRQHDVRDG